LNAESPTPGEALPSKEQLLAFQSTWLRRAGLAAVFGATIVAASIALQQVGLNVPNGNSNADQLVFEHAHAGRLIYTSILLGIGLMLFAVPLYVLFQSVAGRSKRVRRAFVGLVLLGPLAFGIGAAVSSIGSTQAAKKFHDQEPAAVQKARQDAEQAKAAQAKPAPQKANQSPQPTTTAPATTSTTGSTTINLNGTTTTVATPVTPDQAGSNAREELADHLNKHEALLIAGGFAGFVGKLALVFGMIYTSLWCIRTGLLSGFWGIFGIVVGAGLILLGPLGFALLVIWFASVGLMMLGRWPKPLPPAWAEGKAIPPQRRSEDLGPPVSERGDSGTVEGSGREVSESPLPEEGDGGTDPGQALDEYGQTQGQRRKKRKRRS
jgi:hypothetical protein